MFLQAGETIKVRVAAPVPISAALRAAALDVPGHGTIIAPGHSAEGQAAEPRPQRSKDAVAAQLAEMRERLLRDAAASGTAEATVSAAVDDVAAGYADARVTSFLAVLVEREVRTRLKLRPQTDSGAD